jgi:hypothetical protein
MPGLNNPAMMIAADAMKAVMRYAQLHWGPAGISGTANASTAARQPIVWTPTTANGDFSLASTLTFAGGAPSGPVYSMTLWPGSSGGATFYGEFIVSGDPTFSATGLYLVTALNFNGTASWVGAPGYGDGGRISILLPNPSDRLYPVLRPIRRAVGRT